MAEVNGWSLQETHDKLKDYYDGYHFSRRNMVDIYNPFSLINALDTQELGNFWAASGSTSMIAKFIDNIELRLSNFEQCTIMRNILELSDVTGGGAELFLYQSGYLTIKKYDEFGYILGVPNEEVKQALYEMAAAKKQIIANKYLEPFKADKRKAIGLAVELDEKGKGLIDWEEVD